MLTHSLVLRVVMAQLDFLVGDITGNTEKIIAAAQEARDRLRADAIVFPELTVTGYPPEDLLLRPGFVGQVEPAMRRLCAEIERITAIVGYPAPSPKPRRSGSIIGPPNNPPGPGHGRPCARVPKAVCRWTSSISGSGCGMATNPRRGIGI